MPLRWVLAWAAGVMIVAVGLWDAVGSPDELGLGDAVVLGVVEGLTEYLPVSSTGHLTVTERLLGIGHGEDKAAADAYAIVIQAGAILAVAGLYRDRILTMLSGLAGRDRAGRQLVVALVVAFTPAAVLGVALGDEITDRLFGVGPVVAAWAAGGLVILVFAGRLERGGGARLESLALPAAAVVGLAQAVALWPGVSRSLVTILAGLAVGLGLSAAVEFSFLLGLVTLSAATAYEGVRSGGVLLDEFGWAPILVGLVVSLIAAVVSVRWMVGYLNSHGLAVFGWYRLAAAGVGAVLLALGAV